MAEETFNMNKLTFSMKAGKKPFISFSLLFSLTFLLVMGLRLYKGFYTWSSILTAKGIHDTIFIASLLGITPLVLFVWFLGFKIAIEDGVLIYKTLFSYTELPLKEISKYKIKHGFGQWDNTRKPYFRLELYKKHERDPHIMLNLNIFGYADCKRLYEILDEVVAENKKLGPG